MPADSASRHFSHSIPDLADTDVVLDPLPLCPQRSEDRHCWGVPPFLLQLREEQQGRVQGQWLLIEDAPVARCPRSKPHAEVLTMHLLLQLKIVQYNPGPCYLSAGDVSPVDCMRVVCRALLFRVVGSLAAD